MVSKASDDLPDPDSPVITTRLSRGKSTSMFLRLCSRAPRMRMDCIGLNLASPSKGFYRHRRIRAEYKENNTLTQRTQGPRGVRKGRLTNEAVRQRGLSAPPGRPDPQEKSFSLSHRLIVN